MKFRYAVPCLSTSQSYGWYVTAMCRRRAGSELDRDRFISYVTSSDVVSFGDCHRGYIYGQIREGVFAPSHFAPRTLRGGYELINGLADQDVYPVAAFVPEDLAKMFSKTGKFWSVESLRFPCDFRGEITLKTVWTNCGLVLDAIHQAVLHGEFAL